MLNYCVVGLLTRTIIYIFLARVFGSFRFIPCYLPLFSSNFLGLHLEFEPKKKKEVFLAPVTDCLDRYCVSDNQTQRLTGDTLSFVAFDSLV